MPAIVGADEGMARMTHHAQLAIRPSSCGIGYPGRDMLGHLMELDEATIAGKMDLMEQDPPPPLDGMMKAAKGGGPRR